MFRAKAFCSGAVVTALIAGTTLGVFLPVDAQAAAATPTVTGVSADHNTTTGGARVSVIGTHFTSSSTVSFGGVAATHVDVASSTRIRVTVPAHYASRVNVRVRTSAGLSPLTNSDWFYYHLETKVAAGDFHTCQVTAALTVSCWGANGDGQLGDGTTTSRQAPVAVKTVAHVVSVAAGAHHTCALTTSGVVYCWGLNDHGQLGNESTTDSDTPVLVEGLSGQVVALSAGGDDTCAVVVDIFVDGGANQVKCWGDNSDGQIGINSTNDATVPLGPDLRGVIDVDSGGNFTCGVRYSGTVYCWGANNLGQLGTGNRTATKVPVRAASFRHAVSLSSGDSSSCAVVTSGRVYCWGNNSFGQLGNGTTKTSSLPVRVTGLTGVRLVSVGGLHACALVGGRESCWGYNHFGALGDGTTKARHTPVPVDSLTKVEYLSAGFYHSVAMRSTGSVWAWGFNGFGQLGDGTMTDRHVPTEI